MISGSTISSKSGERNIIRGAIMVSCVPNEEDADVILFVRGTGETTYSRCTQQHHFPVHYKLPEYGRHSYPMKTEEAYQLIIKLVVASPSCRLPSVLTLAYALGSHRT
jgi:hypothetical protein